jgi:predicted transcriptional regulator
MSHVVTIRISDESKDRLERLCNYTRRSKSFIAGEAIQEYIDKKLWIMEALEEGLQDLEKGDISTHEEVLAEWKEKAGV